jgi:type II restriction enzyme
LQNLKPALFGLNQSNRDFSKKDSWGKNQFNSSFPASLCAYFYHKGLSANYLTVSNGTFTNMPITINQLFNTQADISTDIFYAFESIHAPYTKYMKGRLPRTDLVINDMNGVCLRGLEVKLTALPDQTTYEKNEAYYGTEIVVRPDTIVYLACSLIENMERTNFDISQLYDLSLHDLDEPQEAIDLSLKTLSMLQLIVNQLSYINCSSPLLVQPIWKTKGKQPTLADNCLDVFVWSDIGFTQFICDIAAPVLKSGRMTRQYRTAVWLYKMIVDYFKDGSFDHDYIIDRLSYNAKNDKAFSSSGAITNKYMRGSNLTLPRIQKSEIKNIILNDGQLLLSPERRFDAIIFNSPDIFE